MREMTKVLTACASVLLLAAGCVASTKTAGENVDDTWIHTKVKSALVGEGTSNINIEVYEGTVQLAGFVDSDQRREKIANLAASVKGVQDISNQLVVQTSSRSAGRALDDGVIASRVKAELADDERTSGIDINVEVRHGVVLLSGFVTSDQERSTATAVARTISGVADVINGIDVIPGD